MQCHTCIPGNTVLYTRHHRWKRTVAATTLQLARINKSAVLLLITVNSRHGNNWTRKSHKIIKLHSTNCKKNDRMAVGLLRFA
jgi:hypothetical protein